MAMESHLQSSGTDEEIRSTGSVAYRRHSGPTTLRISNGALDGLNNKVKLVSHRAFGFRTIPYYIAPIYHVCADLPLPDFESA